jgi:hypothetical protein
MPTCCRGSTCCCAASAAHSRRIRPPAELRRRCIESIANALEQPLDGLENGGYWYEADGFGFLVFASRARVAVMLPEFGATRAAARRWRVGGVRRQDAAGDATPRSLR